MLNILVMWVSNVPLPRPRRSLKNRRPLTVDRLGHNVTLRGISLTSDPCVGAIGLLSRAMAFLLVSSSLVTMETAAAPFVLPGFSSLQALLAWTANEIPLMVARLLNCCISRLIRKIG